ncbi:MAG: ATP-binding protein [Henriciella sp.]|jgi:two-component system osmolarity sensor histidine kinase EnvZ
MSGFRLRDYTPRGLYARLAGLVALPVIAIFAIFSFYYYQEHISEVNEKLSQSIAREVGLIVDICAAPDHSQQRETLVENQLGLRFDCDYPNAMEWPEESRQRFGYGKVLRGQLASVTRHPVEVRTVQTGRVLDFRIDAGDGIVRVLIDRKRALAANTHFTIVWVLLGAVIMLGLAFAFLRNQVRSILRLTEAAKAFGRGRDVPGFRPSGATEIRDAARAVTDMRARLMAFTDQRTAMLAGVSHDLRTPITRLKLQLAMMEQTEEITGARSDLEDMSKMLDEYLAFASGEEGERAETLRLDHITRTVAERIDGVTVVEATEISVTVRPMALTRTLTNLMTNGVGYGTRCEVRLVKGPRMAEILLDDDGPGIPADQREDAFRPFHRLDDARSQNVTGTGLGLTLARDFARAHGGDIRLEDSPMGGLRVRLRLPY